MILLGACSGDAGDEEADPDTPPVEYRRFVAVQVGTLTDSGAAQVLQDSLESAGWVSYVRRAGGGRGWDVRVAPGQNLAWAEVAAAAFGRRGATVVQDSGTVVSQGIAGFTRVSYETSGMITRVRWARSPDGEGLLVVEDATAIENDPAPNGFVFVSEQALNSIQMDSVWDVAPAPDWHRVAFGRAYVLRGEGGGEAPRAAWEALADTLGVTVAALRAAAFPASGMSIMHGVAQPGVARLPFQADTAMEAANGEPPLRLYPVLAGWRIAWSADGNAILAGSAPDVVRDDTPAERWVAIDPMRGDEAGQVEAAAAARVDWVQGPTLDISIPLDTAGVVQIPLAGGDTIVSRNGWIRIGSRIVGPGIALAATREGRYVVALAPNPSAAEYEPKHMAVVYQTGEEPRATTP